MTGVVVTVVVVVTADFHGFVKVAGGKRGELRHLGKLHYVIGSHHVSIDRR